MVRGGVHDASGKASGPELSVIDVETNRTPLESEIGISSAAFVYCNYNNPVNILII